ncbi:MAG: tRNA epoxyqueuosine(34) reductase QueG [Magnetococcales bacterium]|nr:tRNA epoxyqueuosine(34) reductase QueG [Magnetococcales bacterium]
MPENQFNTASAALKERLRRAVLDAGFSAAGFARLGPPNHAACLETWLQAGYHGKMAWMARDPAGRMDPQRLFPQARTLLVAAARFESRFAPTLPDQGAFAAYALRPDYHKILKQRLQTVAAEILGREPAVRIFVDGGPLLEKPLGVVAGLGWQGHHSLLVSRRLGCAFLLAEMLLPVELPEDHPDSDHCGTCRRCLESCPTNAFPAPKILDATRCLSYWTIEHRGWLPPEMRWAMGNRLFGCDDCLRVCPWNRFGQVTGILPLRHDLLNRPLLYWAEITEEAFSAIFRETPVKRLGWPAFLRNVCVALGNWGDGAAFPALRRLAGHTSPLVRGHAAWGLGRLLPRYPEIGSFLDEAAATEEVAEVRTELQAARSMPNAFPATDTRSG